MPEKKTQRIGRLPLFSKKNPSSPVPKQTKSYYKAQLIERQKFRKNFLLTKRQLRNFLSTDKLTKSKLTTTRATDQLVRRLDFLIYTLNSSNGNFLTLREVRQKIRHGHIFVNDCREKRPNYLCEKTDKIKIGYQSAQCIDLRSDESTKLVLKQNPHNDAYAIHFQLLRNFFHKF